jgi:hypothetical protein
VLPMDRRAENPLRPAGPVETTRLNRVNRS